MDELKPERVITPMPTALVSAIDDYRFAGRIASRAEAIRRLIELGLQAAKAPPPPSPSRSAKAPG